MCVCMCAWVYVYVCVCMCVYVYVAWFKRSQRSDAQIMRDFDIFISIIDVHIIYYCNMIMNDILNVCLLTTSLSHTLHSCVI